MLSGNGIVDGCPFSYNCRVGSKRQACVVAVGVQHVSLTLLSKGNFVKKNYIARRRGTSVAAAALSFALVVPFAQSVGAPHTGAVAGAITNNQPADANWEAPEGTIDADGIKNGYVKNATGLTNARNTISGHVGIMESTASSDINGGIRSKRCDRVYAVARQ